MRRITLAFLLCLTTGCSSSSSSTGAQPPAPLPGLPTANPDALGPYAIGVTTFEVPDVPGGLGRTLPVDVWYPALPAAGSAVATYDLTIGTLVLAAVPSPRGAVRDAPLDLRGSPHPTVLFSHGFDGVRFQSVYLTEFLASHGFVVAAPDHVGNTYREAINQTAALPPAEMARLRPMDMSRTLDALLARSADPSDALYLAADPTRVGMSGHSFGGYTALRIAGATIDLDYERTFCAASPSDQFCQGWDMLGGPFPASARDPRFLVSLAQAPGGAELFRQQGLAAIATPMMTQGGTADMTEPFEQQSLPVYEAATHESYLLEVNKAGHFTYSDMCLLLSYVPCLAAFSGNVFDDGCGPANLPPATAHAVIDLYATALFQARLAGQDEFASVLDPAQPKGENVTLFERRP